MRSIAFILASGSPRRRELLSPFIPQIQVISTDIIEKRNQAETPAKYVKRLAKEKALSKKVLDVVLNSSKKRILILAADTIVVLTKSSVLEKPAGVAEANKMLKQIRNRWHQVLTGVQVLEFVNGRLKKERALLCTTRVKIGPLSDSFIRSYVKSREPLDKAGAYAAQGYGAGFIEEVQGSYTNVVGLPLQQVLRLLKEDFRFSPWEGYLR